MNHRQKVNKFGLMKLIYDCYRAHESLYLITNTGLTIDLIAQNNDNGYEVVLGDKEPVHETFTHFQSLHVLLLRLAYDEFMS